MIDKSSKRVVEWDDKTNAKQVAKGQMQKVHSQGQKVMHELVRTLIL